MSKRSSIHNLDLDKFSEHLAAESDRACAVLGAALVDAKLEALFRRRLREFQDDLLKGARPLGAFSARIRLARALAWISDDVRADLDVVRDIRNDFAHSFDHDLSFADQSVSDRCSNLRTAQAFIDGFDLAAVKPGRNLSANSIRAMQNVFRSARKRFEVSVDFLAQYLDEVAADQSPNAGSDLLAEVRALSENTRIQARGNGTVENPPTHDQSVDGGAGRQAVEADGRAKS